MKGQYKAMPEGARYGSLVVLKRPIKKPLQSHQNLCRCDCGRVLIVTTHMLSSGKITDCGCVKHERKSNDMYPERIKGLDNMASAIVTRAIADYKQAVMINLKNGSYSQLRELRKFFKSDWFKALTDLDGEVLMKCIEQECVTEFEEREKKKHGHKDQVPEGHSAD